MKIKNGEALTEEQIKEAIAETQLAKKNATVRVTETIASPAVKVTDNVTEATTDAIPSVAPVAQPTALTLDDVSKLLDDRETKAKDAVKAEYEQLIKAQQEAADKAIADQKAALDAINENLKETATKLSRYEDLYKLQGISAPTVVSSVHGDRQMGAFKEAVQVLNSAPLYQINTSEGETTLARDTREFDSYVHSHKNEVLRDLESAMKANGFLRGTSAGQVVKDASSSKADLPEGFLDTLSSLMRMEHYPANIFWQFANTRIEFGKGNGDTIRVPRSPFIAAPTSLSDFELSGDGTFADIATTANPISSSSISAILKEYGLGKSGVSNNAPIGIPNFVQAYSMLDLLGILNRNLRYNYVQFEDLGIRSVYESTTRVLYNSKNTVTTTATDIAAAGDVGTLTEQYLNELFAYMRGLQIPTLPDGNFIYVLNTQALKLLKNDLATRNYYMTADSKEELTSQLIGLTGNLMERPSGYVGKLGGFHIFEQNAFGLGAAGTEGVTSVTLGGSLGAKTMRSSYAFGIDAVGRGIGMPMEIRPNSDNTFGRQTRYIWLSYESFTALDVDPARSGGSASERLRVVETRFADVKI